jgi:hypothetical protein
MKNYVSIKNRLAARLALFIEHTGALGVQIV